MRQALSFLFAPCLFISLNASALLISETYIFEKQLPASTWVGHDFVLTSAGYSPDTDSITNIKLIYDFTEIMSPTNLGDEDFFKDSDEEVDINLYSNEVAYFSSSVFYPRDTHPDVDTGLTIFETNWTRNNECQLENELTGACEYSLDLNGSLSAYVQSGTDNLWLHSIKVEIEVDRAEVPEPNSLLLFGLGLFAIGFLRRLNMHRQQTI